jgi:murein L,D-transpeptidase YcbB/YkuD
MPRSFLLAVVCAVLVSTTDAPLAHSQSRPDQDVAATVDQVLTAATHPGLTWGSISDVAATLKPVYDAEPDRLVWFDGATPSPSLETTLATVRAAGDHGLNPADYDAATLSQQWAAIARGSVSPRERAYFDLGVSVACARMIKAVHAGRVDPETMNWGYDITPKQVDVAGTLRRVSHGTALSAALDSLQPPFSHYLRARRMLAVYRTLAQAGEPDAVPDLPKPRAKVEPGQSWVGVPPLAERLRILGDLPAGTLESGSTYGGPLVDAVKRFQMRHGLDSDGVIGPGTLRAINVPLARRVRQIELAMERMRWLPQLSDRPNVFVNVPLFRMWADDPSTGAEPLRMNVVVGQSLNHKTPIFVERMEYVIFRPYWNPPRSIIVNEIVPKARKDPGYMAREALEIVASDAESAAALPPTPDNLTLLAEGKLRVRQKPGPSNSLGLAKFIFPNDDNVYMHGTPAQALFSRVRRDFSHGCIRLEDPARFAEWVLRDQPDWSRTHIDEAMHEERPTRVNLKAPLTVVLFYDTVHVNSENVVFFVDDIYGHDRALEGALARGYPYPVKRAIPHP